MVTTLVSRLLVADVFVHGIGGAAYDQLTDAAHRLHAFLRPGDPVTTSVAGQPVRAEVMELPARCPGGDYLLRCVFGSGTDQDVVLVRRGLHQFHSNDLKEVTA